MNRQWSRIGPRIRTPGVAAPAVAAIAVVATASACGGDDVAGPTDAPALAAELEGAFAVFASTAFGEVGRGVQVTDVLGGSGPETIAAHAGTLFRWSLDENRYVADAEPGP